MIQFNEANHTYKNELGKLYISATTVLGRYKEFFDSAFWSKYKAIEQFIIENNSQSFWNDWKREVGFRNVNVEFYKNAKDTNKFIVEVYQQEILEKWEYEKNIACFNGSNFHEAKEKGWLDTESHVVNGKTFKTQEQGENGKSLDLLNLEDGIYSELVLYNNQFEVAGQADIVFVETIDNIKYIDIDDYKTNKKISIDSFFNKRTGRYKMMLPPLSTEKDCNHSHYQLQISLYAYMLECFGYVVRNLQFQHWNNIGTKEEPKYEFDRVYKLDYKKKQIIKMLKHYKRNK